MEKKYVHISNVNASTVALGEAVLGLIWGLAIVVMASLSGALGLAASTDSLLVALMFGMEPGFTSMILVPVIYLAAGWVIGYLHGLLFNQVATVSTDGVKVATKHHHDLVEEAVPSRVPAATRRAEPTFGETIGNRRVK